MRVHVWSVCDILHWNTDSSSWILDIGELNLPKTCQTDFPDPDDLLNFKLLISPDEVRKLAFIILLFLLYKKVNKNYKVSLYLVFYSQGFYRNGRFVFSFKVSYFIGWHSRINCYYYSSLSLHILPVCIDDRCCSSETCLSNNCGNFPESYFLTAHSAKFGIPLFGDM